MACLLHVPHPNNPVPGSTSLLKVVVFRAFLPLSGTVTSLVDLSAIVPGPSDLCLGVSSGSATVMWGGGLFTAALTHQASPSSGLFLLELVWDTV